MRLAGRLFAASTLVVSLQDAVPRLLRALVKTLVGAYGGSIAVESEEEKGTCVTVCLSQTAPMSCMKRLIVVLALGTLFAGCAALDWFRDTPEGRSEPARLVARADELVRQGQPSAARDLYAQVVAGGARGAVHAQALYNLARLYVDPSSGLRDYRSAKLAFERLLTEYPNGEWAPAARAWHAALAELVAREAELVAREAELAAREAELVVREAQRVVREAEAARLRNEAAKLAADLQRLKRIDLKLERRR